MDNDLFDPYAYDAAYRALVTGRWSRDLPGTARRVSIAVADLHSTGGFPLIASLVDDADGRRPLVTGLLASVNVAHWQEARPLFDEAVAAAAEAIWRGPQAIRWGYPLPADHKPEATR